MTLFRLNSLSFTSGTRRNNDWSGESERERRGRTPPRQERAVSEPLIQKKKSSNYSLFVGATHF